MAGGRTTSDHGATGGEVIARITAGDDLDLGRHDPAETFGWHKGEAKRRFVDIRDEVAELQKVLFAERTRALLVVLQAMDAGGKDGVLRDVLTGINPAGVDVTSFRAPSEDELAHDPLWRVHAHTPAKGQIGVFNRSHYEDVLVVRVKGLVPEIVWRRRYEHIRHFEQLLVDEGTAIVKIYLNLSPEEQRERFQDRIDSPDERWKFRRGDLDDRKLWPEYMRAYREAIARTSTTDAPWYVVPADRKWVRNLTVAHILHHALTRLHPAYPPPEAGLDGLEVARLPD